MVHEKKRNSRVARRDVDAHGKYRGIRALRRRTREDEGERMIDRSREGDCLLDHPYIRDREERNAQKGSAWELLYGGIGKFRCETKKGKSGGADAGRISTTSTRKRDEVHQACGSGFVRPLLFPSRVFAVRNSYFYRLWQFPRTL